MRKIREVLRLKGAGISERRIAAAVGVVRSTVQECLRRARDAGVSWPLAEELDDHSLEERLYPRPSLPRSATKPEPDFAYIHAELSRPGVTRLLLWQEYKAAHAHGWQYTSLARVCERATAAS